MPFRQVHVSFALWVASCLLLLLLLLLHHVLTVFICSCCMGQAAFLNRTMGHCTATVLPLYCHLSTCWLVAMRKRWLVCSSATGAVVVQLLVFLVGISTCNRQVIQVMRAGAASTVSFFCMMQRPPSTYVMVYWHVAPLMQSRIFDGEFLHYLILCKAGMFSIV
jgi:hypothetical protein